MPPFRAAQIVGARLAFFVSRAHVKDRLEITALALVFSVGREGDLARAKADVDDLLTVGPVLRMGAQNACIALPVRYIE